MPATYRRIAAKLENRCLLFHSHGFKYVAVYLTEFLPFDEIPKGLSNDIRAIQMPSGILAGKL